MRFFPKVSTSSTSIKMSKEIGLTLRISVVLLKFSDKACLPWILPYAIWQIFFGVEVL